MLFSIIIPAYKRYYLKEAIQSVLGQSFSDYELIIVDDCSPEPLDEIVLGFKSSSIKFFRNPRNFGARDLVTNWNSCLERCCGEYVICMGDDDRLLPDCLKNYALKISENPEMDIFHCRTEIIDENGTVTAIQEERPLTESALSLLCHRLDGSRIRQYIGDFCIKRKTLVEKGGYAYIPFAWGSDDLTAFICSLDYGIYNIPEFGFQYRESSSSISRSGHNAEKIEATNILAEKYRSILNRYDAREDEKLLLDRCLGLLPAYYRKRAVVHMSYDIRSNVSSLPYWISHRKEIHVGIYQVLSAAVRAIIKKD